MMVLLIPFTDDGQVLVQRDYLLIEEDRRTVSRSVEANGVSTSGIGYRLS